MEDSTRKKSPLGKIFLFFVVLAALFAGLFFYFKDTPLETQTGNDSVTQIVPEETTEKLEGTISGSLSYPSEFIPETMEVCAIEVGGSTTYCTKEHLKDTMFTYGQGYILSLPAGVYFVYAFVPNQPDAVGEVYKAYYSEFVTCGLDVSCTSHDPIEVTVFEGAVVDKIDPQDWYK